MKRWSLLRDALRDVPDDELPGLRDIQSRNVTYGLLLSILAGTPVFIIDAWADDRLGGRIALFVVAWVATYWALWHLHLRAFQHRPHVTLFLMGVVLAFSIAATPWLTAPVPTLQFVDLMLVVPLINTMISFPRARLVPPLVVLVISLELGSVYLVTGRLPEHAVMHAASIIALGMLAMASTSGVRRMWHQWEKGKSEIRAADRMAQLGRMTAGLAHELKTPIAATDNAVVLLASLSDELQQSIGDPQITHADLREIAAELGEQSTTARRANARVAAFVRAMREHTQGMCEQDARTIDMAHQLDTVRTMMSHRLRKAGVTLDLDLAEDLHLIGDAGKLEQLLTNLVENAVNAITESGVGNQILVRARQRGDALVLEVIDDGPGVPEAHATRVFDYLFTTRSGGQGTGLGLAICRDIAEGSFHGSLDMADSDSRGAHFVAVLRSAPDGHTRAAPVAFTPSQGLSEPRAA